MKTVLALIVLAALAALAWKENQTADRLREENARLTTWRAEADKLQADLTAATNAPGESGEIARLTAENRDLLKLRNEVRQLRENKAEYDRLTAQNAALQHAPSTSATIGSEPAFKPIFYSADSLRPAGFQSPTDALETMFFNLKQRDPDAFLRCFAGELTESQKRDCMQLFKGASGDIINGFTGFQIESIKGPQSGRCLLTVSTVLSGQNTQTDETLMTNTPDGWKMFPGNP